MKDVRDWLKEVEGIGELRKISAEVDWDDEMSGLKAPVLMSHLGLTVMSHLVESQIKTLTALRRLDIPELTESDLATMHLEDLLKRVVAARKETREYPPSNRG